MLISKTNFNINNGFSLADNFELDKLPANNTKTEKKKQYLNQTIG